MKRNSLPIISTFFLIFTEILSSSLIKADQNKHNSETSRTGKAFNPSVHESQDYENDYYTGKLHDKACLVKCG